MFVLCLLVLAATPAKVNALFEKSAALQREGRFLEAQAPLLEILALVKDPASPDRVQAQNNLGTAYRRNGEAAKAISVLEPLVATLSTAKKPARPEDLRVSMNNLAMAYLYGDRTADAKKLWERCLTFVPKTGDDEEAARVLDNLAGLLLSVNDAAGALPLATRASVVWLKLHGKESIDYGVSQSVLGTIALRQGRLDEGRTHLRAALAIHGKVLGEAHPDNAKIFNLLGELEFLAGRADAARQALVRSMEISKAAGFAFEHPQVQAAVAGLKALDRAK